MLVAELQMHIIITYPSRIVGITTKFRRGPKYVERAKIFLFIAREILCIVLVFNKIFIMPFSVPDTFPALPPSLMGPPGEDINLVEPSMRKQRKWLIRVGTHILPGGYKSEII